MDKEEIDNRQKVEIAALSSDLDALAVAENIDLKAARRRVDRRIGFNRIYMTLRTMQRAAAILFVPLLAFTLWLGFDREALAPEPVPAMLEMQTSAGTIGRVVLPDSSVVMLNAGSVLRYPSFFSGGERRVELYGEAYLEVSKDSAHRFVVGLPDGAEIAVYGTKFNVDAYKDEPCIATLVEGSIGYCYRADDGVEQELRLKPNQRLRRDIAEGSLEITTTDCSCETAWKDGVILLNSTPLDEILRIVGRKYQVKFDVRNKDLASYTFSGGRLSVDDGVERILETLRISSQIRWRYDSTDDNTISEIVIY